MMLARCTRRPRSVAAAISLFVACGGDASRRPSSASVPEVETPRAPAADASDTASTGAFRAIGTEPFWSLEINSAGLRFTTPEDTMGISFPPLAPRVTGDTLRWTGETERAPIDARIWPARCSDGMSDRVWTYTAVVRIDGTTYRGCAEARALVPHPANNRTDQWLGQWIGPEGTSLALSKNGAKYVVTIRSLDGLASYEGVPTGDRIQFQRDGKAESIRAGSGEETGMKWLMDKKDCLIINRGEGFCR